MATTISPVGAIILILVGIFVIVGGFWLFLLDDVRDWIDPEGANARLRQRWQNCEESGLDCIVVNEGKRPLRSISQHDLTKRI